MDDDRSIWKIRGILVDGHPLVAVELDDGIRIPKRPDALTLTIAEAREYAHAILLAADRVEARVPHVEDVTCK